MYIKEELQSTLIGMLVELASKKVHFFFKVMDHLGVTDLTRSIKGFLHVNVGCVLLSHLVAFYES